MIKGKEWHDIAVPWRKVMMFVGGGGVLSRDAHSRSLDPCVEMSHVDLDFVLKDH